MLSKVRSHDEARNLFDDERRLNFIVKRRCNLASIVFFDVYVLSILFDGLAIRVSMIKLRMFIRFLEYSKDANLKKKKFFKILLLKRKKIS